MSASSRNLAALAERLETPQSPSQTDNSRRSRRSRSRLEDVSGTPTRHSGQRSLTSSQNAWRPPWTPPGAGQHASNALPPLSGLPPLSRPQPAEYGQVQQQQHDPRWAANGNSAGGHSSVGGWGSSSGGGNLSGASSGGGNAFAANAFTGNRHCHDSFASTQKPAAVFTPERLSQRPSPVPERSRAAAYTPDFSPSRPSPVPGRGRTPELSNASTPTTGQMPDYQYPSSRKPAQLPDYMKVFTVPKDVHYEEDVVIEPIIQNLGIGDKDMERRITEQMGNLYDFFRRLYDQDQEEIRCLQSQVEQRDMELRRLRRSKLTAQGDEEEACDNPTSANVRRHARDQMQSPTRHVKAAGLARQSAACSPAPPSPAKPPSKPVVSLVVPPVTSPARPFFKWWANVQDLYTRRSTLWQGLLFLLLLIIAVGLLAGLLSNRSSNTSRSATFSVSTSSLTPPDPAVTGLWSTGLAFSANMSQGISAYFALIPTVALLASNHTPVAADVVSLLQGPELSSLSGLAVACGERTALQNQTFTFSIAASIIAMADAAVVAAPPACEVAGALPDRCSLCPNVQPATAYTLLVAFSDSDDVYKLLATTAPLTSTSGLNASSPPPPLPSPSLLPTPSLLPSPSLLPLPSPSPSTSSTPSPSPPPLAPGVSASPTAPPAPLAPSLKLAPTVSAAGPTSFDLTFALTAPGLVRLLVTYPVLYAQAGDVFVSFASADPPAGQALVMAPPPSSAVLGLSGVVAAGTINATGDLLYTVRVDGALPGSGNTVAACSCSGGGCRCSVAAPCQGQMCNLGPSALTADTTYKVFISTSTPDGSADTQGPVYVGNVTTGSDLVGPALSASTAIAQRTVTPTGFSLSGLQLDTEGFIYVMVSKPSGGQQSIPAGTATTLREDVVTVTRRRQLLALRGRARGLTQQTSGNSSTTTSVASLLVTDPAPAVQVFRPACPRQVSCDTAAVYSSYLDQAVEALALPIRCVALANIRDAPLVQALDGLANDTAYIVRVVTEDVARNQRVYRALVRTVDRRPPDITAASVQTSFRSFNLSLTLSEPGALVGFLYTAAAAASVFLTAPASWPPSPQGPVLQQVSAATSIPANGISPTGPTTYVLAFNDSSVISPKTSYAVALVARDLVGNVQPSVRLVAVRTDDNIPPVWLAAGVQPGAVTAALAVQLDEPSTAFWFCLTGNVSCPSVDTLFGAVDGTSALPSGLISRDNLTVAIDGGNASTVIAGLRDGATYTLCLVAQDASPLQNRQLNSRRLAFSTADRTPPTLLVAVLPGTDGNFTCDRSTLRCRLSLNISLSERGTSVLALQYADARLSNFTAPSLIATDPNAPPAGVLRAVAMPFASTGSLEVHLSDLASGRGYVLDVAAVDTSGNTQPALQSMALAAPDVMPPAFLRFAAASTADTFITLNVSLNEPGAVLWLATATGAQAPNASQLLGAVQANRTLLAGSAPYAPAVSGGPVSWDVGGLAVGQVYDVHLLARDTSGNVQAAVTSILRVRVQDSTPPVVYSLTTSLAPTGNRVMISVNASKPGMLRYIALRPGAVLPSRQQLLQPPSATNFSGSLPVPAAGAVASAVICVVDGGSYDIWAVQEDTEGQYSDRQPNYSNVTRATQLPQPSGSDGGTCSPERRMRALLLDTALATGSFGWPVGRLTSTSASTTSTTSSGNAAWVRDYVLVGGLGGGVGSNGSVVASMEGQQLGSLEFQPIRPSPTQVRVVVQTPALYLEPTAAVTSAVADTGRVLRFAFQLLDAASRPTSLDGLRVVPRLSATGSYAALVLSDCSVTLPVAGTASSLPSGVGLCRVEVPVQAFPAAGVAMNASLRVDLYNGSTLLLSSALAQLTLRSAAVAAPSAPASAVVLLLALPTRALRLGETFRTTLSAVVGSQQVMSSFTVKVLYNASRLTFVRADKSALWSELEAAPLAQDGGVMELWLNSIQRTAADSMYGNRTVPLLDAYFKLTDSAGPDGSELAALTVDDGTSSSSGSMVWLSGSQPSNKLVVVYQDFRGVSASTATAGSISVATPRQLGLLAYLTNHDLFNSAALDGKMVVAPIQAFFVADWAASGTDSSTLTLPSGARCSCSAPANTSSALTVSSCQVVLTADHTTATKQARLSVACFSGANVLQAQAVVSVWYPGSHRVELSDPDGTLSSLLPINVPESAVGSCTGRYQSSRLHLFTTWVNGGNSSQDDYLNDVDVTRLVANWTTDAPEAVRLSSASATATGLSPHPGVNVSALSAAGRVLASAQVAVSSEPVCVESLEAVALSGVSIASDMAPPNSLGRWRVRFTPQQALNWEGASAKVSVFATFSDGTVMAVSGASVTAAQPLATASGNASSTILPFSLQPLSGNPSLGLTVNTSFGSPATCGTYLRTSWSMCSLASSGGSGSSVLMATGSGTVRVALPTPTRIDSIPATSLVVTSAGSGASQPPISVPTQSFLRVLVAFDDGGIRDMTNDSRVQVLVYQGADLCRVSRDSTTGQPYVEAIAGKSGNCELEARATFPGLPVLRNTTTTTVVTFMSLQVYVPDGTPALPPTTNSSVLTNLVLPIDPIYLFKCDFSHYMPASVWAMGQLSSCGASCNLADLNDPAITRLLLTDTSVANLATNPNNVSLTNVLNPVKPGKSILRVTFGSAISNLFTVSVEDPFQPGWPRVLAINDTALTLAANMSSGAYKVTYLVMQDATGTGSTTSTPSAADVERAGVAMTAVNCSSQSSPCLMLANVGGLAPASNYTVYLAVRFEVARQSKLISTVVAISGVLTPDTQPPTFTALGAVQNVTLDTQRFRVRIPVALSETGTISYVIYHNSSCIAGADQLSVQTVRGAGSLPTSICSCSDTSLCQPVASGNITLSGDQLADVLTVNGLLPPNPYNGLSTSTPDQLTCGTDSLPAPTTAAHLLFLVAQDDLPTYKDWNVTCAPPASSPGTSCPAAALAPCSAVPPANGSAAGGINLQTSPYRLLTLGAAVPANATGSPLLASFDLPSGDRVSFDQLATNVTVTSRTITFLFKVNRVSAVQYRLDQFNGPKVFSGIYPVYDPAVSYTVTISKSCNGKLLADPSYTLWYWATDIYGRSSLPLSSSVVLG